MVKAFLFDYDGVITSGVSDMAPAERLARNIGVPIERAAEWIVSMWRPFVTGKVTEDAVWQEIEKHYGKPITAAQRDIWYKWEELTPLPEMIELVQLLKDNGYAVGVLSNVIAPSQNVVVQHGGYDAFDFALLSCELGCRKPDAEIFEKALERLGGLRPDEVVFLDDREPATIAARELGIRAIHVTDHAQAREAVKALLGAGLSVTN